MDDEQPARKDWPALKDWSVWRPVLIGAAGLIAWLAMLWLMIGDVL